MSKLTPRILPSYQQSITGFGARLRLARLRRNLSMEQVAERAGISRATLSRIENGDPTVIFGNYFNVMRILNLDKDLGLLAMDDTLGRKLQDLNLTVRQRSPKTKRADHGS